jgi:glutamyl-tRNA synthetase
VQAYRAELGIHPEALFNYLLRLGRGHGDREEFTPAEAVEVFDLDGIGKSPSRFDLKKLHNLNGHYIRAADDARLATLVASRIGPEADLALLEQAMPVLKLRARDLNELADGAAFLFKTRPLALTEQAAALLSSDAQALLGRIWARLHAEPDWTSEALEASLKAFAEELGLGLGKLAQPLRAALTGQTTSPGIFDVLVLLGREESLARIDAQAQAA